MSKPLLHNQGLTLFEVVVVIALVAFVYAVAIPQFSLRSGAEAASKTARLAEDVRSAFDMAVLTGKPYRLVFELDSGKYWLETTNRQSFTLGDTKQLNDPTPEEEADLDAADESAFIEYDSLAGEPIVDQETQTEFLPVSPVLKAKEHLMRPKWTKVRNLEWRDRDLGPYLMISSMRAEHHLDTQNILDLPENSRCFLYFLPNGYVERAWIIVSYKKGSREPDESVVPYTFKTEPYAGTLDVIATGEESAVVFD